MHSDEIDIDMALVGRLVASQFPGWRAMPCKEVDSAGTDNAMFRLGHEMVIRLPRIALAERGIEKEIEWLPRLAPHIPFPIPEVLGVGEPRDGYPFRWAIYTWLAGEEPTPRVAGSKQLATDLAEFVLALRDVQIRDGTGVNLPESYRGGSLVDRDAFTRAAIVGSAGLIDTSAATEVWESALELPQYQGARRWFHGDIKPDNILTNRDRLTGIIDFGCLAVGDPAVDQIVAWNLLTHESRKVFRDLLAADEDTWARGRAWALTIGLLQLPYYKESNPRLARVSKYQIGEIIADYRARL
jgi:aminoglycoside phosphotransferase (APT) family kinase protein